jgi:hypothetical protein
VNNCSRSGYAIGAKGHLPLADDVEMAVEHHQTIRREGEYWTIVFDGAVCRLRDGRGFRHLEYLLRHPREEVSSLFLDLRCGDDKEVADELKARARVGAHDARERARVNVTRAIVSVLRRIEQHHPALGEHLAATVRTGAFCSYTPDPRVRVEWTP